MGWINPSRALRLYSDGTRPNMSHWEGTSWPPDVYHCIVTSLTVTSNRPSK